MRGIDFQIALLSIVTDPAISIGWLRVLQIETPDWDRSLFGLEWSGEDFEYLDIFWVRFYF